MVVDMVVVDVVEEVVMLVNVVNVAVVVFYLKDDFLTKCMIFQTKKNFLQQNVKIFNQRDE